MIQKLRMRLCNKLLYTGLRFVESRGIGENYARLTTDVNRLSGSATQFLNSVQAMVMLIVCLAYIGWLSWIGLAATLLTIVLGVGTYFVQDKETTRNIRLARAKEVEFFDSINDLLHGFKEIKINRDRHSSINDEVAGISNKFRDLNVRAEILFIKSHLTSQTFTFALIGILVFILPTFFANDTIIIFQFLAALLFMVGPLEAVVSTIPSMSKARVSLQNVRTLEHVMDNMISANENRTRSVESMQFDSLDFDQVCFHFEGAHSDERFDVGPIKLSVPRGEILFIVGGNGSGKTTLLKLLTGLYVPVSGRILINGKAFSSQEYQAYREMFTTIFNDFHLFKRLYGIDEKELNRLDELLTILQLDQKTHYQDDQFTTINLSTGQRKRLAYAVCYLEDRQIYVFDEFAADQDPEFRNFFYRQLLPELKRLGKTIVVVTHDDSYFDACDRLVKMDHGQIVELEDRRVTA
jgi:putative ATP-binding cassette transporter